MACSRTAPTWSPGVGLIVGVDRFMSEARALTNFSGNAVATVVIGNWVREIDGTQAERVFSGEDPFDEPDMLDDDDEEAPELGGSRAEPSGTAVSLDKDKEASRT